MFRIPDACSTHLFSGSLALVCKQSLARLKLVLEFSKHRKKALHSLGGLWLVTDVESSDLPNELEGARSFNPKSEFSLRQIKLVLFQAVMRE
jgi:hypothetical protein